MKLTKEYFEDHQRKFRQAIFISEIYCRKAIFYKHIYEITRLKWAKEKNQYYVNKGYKLLFGCLGVLAVDFAVLDEYLKSFGE